MLSQHQLLTIISNNGLTGLEFTSSGKQRRFNIDDNQGLKKLNWRQSINTYQSMQLKCRTINYWQLLSIIGVVTTRFALDFFLFCWLVPINDNNWSIQSINSIFQTPGDDLWSLNFYIFRDKNIFQSCVYVCVCVLNYSNIWKNIF